MKTVKQVLKNNETRTTIVKWGNVHSIGMSFDNVNKACSMLDRMWSNQILILTEIGEDYAQLSVLTNE